MAIRPFFQIGNGISNFYQENSTNFDFFSGFAITQKRKSIKSLHESILTKNPNARILEVSRRSENELGIQLSAFNLMFEYSPKVFIPVENVFQSSKVFFNGKQYLDLLHVSPSEAKTDERLKNSGNLVEFKLKNESWDISPSTMFYDYIYLSALKKREKLCEELMQFDTFTDIEFNPQKSINCQARTVAIFVTLNKYGLFDKFISDKELFKSIYLEKPHSEGIQTSLF